MNWMESQHMNTTHIKVIKGTYTGQAFITTDMDDNQITAFHPGAMSVITLICVVFMC
jgi:adenosine kinase